MDSEDLQPLTTCPPKIPTARGLDLELELAPGHKNQTEILAFAQDWNEEP